MAAVTGTVHSVRTLEGGAWDREFQLAEVLFTISSSQTYAQADNGILAGVAALISGSRRNGMTPSLKAVMAGRPATKTSNPAAIMSLKTVAISTNDVTFEVTDGDWSTELANGAMPDQNRPFSILVAFTEA